MHLLSETVLCFLYKVKETVIILKSCIYVHCRKISFFESVT
jgi:hypothetical protein